MNKKLSLEILRIKYAFPDEVKRIADSYTHTAPILRRYATVYDYVAILFYYHFVEQLENSEIAQIVNVSQQNIYRRLYDYGWGHSKDYTINKERHNTIIEKLNQELAIAKYNIKRPYEQYPLFNSLKLSAAYRNLQKPTWGVANCNTKEEYLKLLFYFTQLKEEKLSPRELAWMFDVHTGAMHERLSKLGLSMTLQEGVENKTKRKTQDYNSTMRSGKRTRMRQLQEDATSGSKNESLFRDELSLKIYDYFYEDFYEVVVGTNTVGIIHGKEIDIPVIIFNSQTNTWTKFAIEYNGKTYHQTEDTTKMKLLKEKDWIYFPVEEENNDGSHMNSLKYIRTKVIKTIKELKKIVEAT